MVYSDGGTWYPEACNGIRIETLFTFIFREKFDGKSQPVFQE